MENPSENSLEKALALLEKENREFEGHWVWKRLGLKPDEFFTAFEKHAASLNIPKEKWEEALNKARDASQSRTREKRVVFNPMHLQLLQNIQV